MKLKKILPLLLSGLLISTSFAGCDLFASETEEEPDQIITISVTRDMLLSAEEDTIPTKSVDELYKVGQIFEYNGTQFIELIPGKKLIAEDADVALVRFKDNAYIDALSKAKDSVYVSADIIPMSQTKTSQSFQLIYNALAGPGTAYADLFNRIAEDKEKKAKVNTTVAAKDAVVINETPEEVPEETPAEPTGDENIEETPSEDNVDAKDATIEEDIDINQPVVDDRDNKEVESDQMAILSDLINQYNASVGTGKVYYTKDQLQNIVLEYYKFMNFSTASNLVFYDETGTFLGAYSSNQLNAYMCKVLGETASYTLISGYAKLSDFLSGVTYETTAIDNGNGQFTMHIKNDTNRPAIVTVTPVDAPDKSFKIPFLTDSFKVTGYYPENEYSIADIYTTYQITYEHIETNKDVATAFENEPDVLKISSVQPDEKGNYSFPSEYKIIINNTASDILIVSNSGEEETLKSGTVIAVHPEMYKSFKFTVVESVPEEE